MPAVPPLAKGGGRGGVGREQATTSFANGGGGQGASNHLVRERGAGQGPATTSFAKAGQRHATRLLNCSTFYFLRRSRRLCGASPHSFDRCPPSGGLCGASPHSFDPCPPPLPPLCRDRPAFKSRFPQRMRRSSGALPASWRFGPRRSSRFRPWRSSSPDHGIAGGCDVPSHRRSTVRSPNRATA